LQDQRDLYASIDATDDEAADTAEAAVDTIESVEGMDADGEFGEYYYSENWSAEDLDRVEKLQEASNAASAALIEAESAAIERARERMGGKAKPVESASD